MSMTPGGTSRPKRNRFNRFTYYGQQIDPVTQQYYLRARFYNPVVGRFIQEDIYRGDGLNLYAYCANNPICYVDYTGHEKDVLGKVPSFADQFEKHYREELEFAKKHGLLVHYDTPEAIQQNLDIVTGMPRGQRPEPSTYLPESYIKNHLAMFEGGVSKITSWNPTASIGKPGDRIFVMPSTVADDLIRRANGDVHVLESLLGLQTDELGPMPYRIDIHTTENLYLPTGNEKGANSFWIAGGYTSGGIPEAVVDPIPFDDFTAGPVWGN